MEASSAGNITVADCHQNEVQVKSSNADPDENTINGANDEATNASDDDLDATKADLPSRPLAIGEVTPATARTVNQTVMETPHATTRPQHGLTLIHNEDNQPYSTAPQALRNSPSLHSNV